MPREVHPLLLGTTFSLCWELGKDQFYLENPYGKDSGSAPGLPTHQGVQQGDTGADLQRKKCQGYPGAMLPTEALRLPSRLTLAPLVRRDVTSRLNSAGRTILPSWQKKRVEEVCWWVTARRLVHLNLQNPPLQPHGSHLTTNKAPTSEERSR